jgi:predicted nuclease of restriction endonuclease-like (RecB) superfamily
VQAKEKADERNIEQQLTDQITKFLLELGKGFAFIGKQVHIEVEGKAHFYIDLPLYHTRLHAYVVVELKARDFEAASNWRSRISTC